MNHRPLCLFALCFALTACSGGEPPTEPAATGEAPAAGEPAAETAADELDPDPGIVVDEAFLDHMHAHAEMLDEINYALADGELESAITPAYWLAQHDDLRGMPEEWKPYAEGMREAAAAVESAPDLATARAAADEIAQYCIDCHVAAGLTDEGN